LKLGSHCWSLLAKGASEVQGMADEEMKADLEIALCCAVGANENKCLPLLVAVRLLHRQAACQSKMRVLENCWEIVLK